MKKIHFLFMAALLVLACCQSDKKEHEPAPKPQEVKDTTIVAGVYHYQFDGFEMWTLQDMQRGMSMDLFPKADPAVVKKLVPTGEAEAAINAFLVKRGDEYILFDAGLGLAQGGAMLDKLVMLDIKPEQIHTVMLTHFHGDHCTGLAGLLLSLAKAGRDETFHIWGPKGLKRVVEGLCVIVPPLSYPVMLHEIPANGGELEAVGLKIRAFPVDHGGIPCYGFRVTLPRSAGSGE